MIQKLQKHYTIFKSMLNQSAEVKAIRAFDNAWLNAVVDAFLAAKEANFSGEDMASFERCEQFRNQLLQDESLVSYEIFQKDDFKKVADICQKAASPKTWCHFIYKIIRNAEIKSVLEIGTNLGVSGTYILEGIKVHPNPYFVTMEGVPQLCEIATKQFEQIIPTDKFSVFQGLYQDTFPEVTGMDISFDLLFIDGNHQKDPTIEYFNVLKEKIGDRAIFIFDDINWSKGMKEAWQIVSNDPQVNYSIDLYKQGIVIIDKKDSNKHKKFRLHLSY